MNISWEPVLESNMPPREKDPFYGERYSVPVLAGNEITGQVSIIAYAWDFENNGWVHATLENGADPCDYEVQYVSHWATWPECHITTG
jgi:hypothetical protein